MGASDVRRAFTPLQMLEIMWAMDHAMRARSKRMQKTVGVTAPQRIVLRRLDARGPMSAAALASSLHLHPSTLTGILQRLDSSGHVSRKKDTEDSRRIVVSLTASGKKLARRVAGSTEHIVAAVFDQSTDHEIACAVTVLSRLAAALAL